MAHPWSHSMRALFGTGISTSCSKVLPATHLRGEPPPAGLSVWQAKVYPRACGGAAHPPTDDGQGAALRLLHRRGLLEDFAFRVFAANNTPDFRTISDFRKDHLKALADLFHQVLELCQKAGLVKLGHVVLPSTKVKANASKHKAMSDGRMKEKEERLKTEVDELPRRAQEVDEDEDRRHGRDKRGTNCPRS